MELWDVYDIDRKNTGETMERGNGFAEGAHHMGAHICVFNSEGKMLIQKRQAAKSGYGGRWDLSAGGSSLSNVSRSPVTGCKKLKYAACNAKRPGSSPVS